MIRIFRKKSQKEILEATYKRLLDESYRLSQSDQETSDKLAMEADDLLQIIMNLKSNHTSS